MVTKDEVKKLAELSRLALTDAEVETLRGEIDSILSYVDTIQKVELPPVPDASPYLDVENVMRDDTDPHEGGAFTDAILAQAPKREGRYIKVKKILG